MKLRDLFRRKPRVVNLGELPVPDPDDHDDAEDTDHLARLADPEVLARVKELEDAAGSD